jgi:hypothetical protein
MGLSSTAAIFDILARRPWITHSIRTVNVLLKLNHVLPVIGGVAVNTSVLDHHPWLRDRLRIAELKVVKFEMGACGLRWVPDGWWRVVQPRNWSLGWLKTLGVNLPVGTDVEKEDDVEDSHEHNTLPDLAKLFDTFPLLEKIDIETEHRNLLSLFPAPTDTAESFRALDERGVEVNILVKHWQIHSFCNMLYQNGAERGTIRFGNGTSKGRIALSYETQPGGRDHGHRIVSFRLIDCVVKSEGSEDDSSADISWRKRVGAMWLWRKKVEPIQAAEVDEVFTEPALEGEATTL